MYLINLTEKAYFKKKSKWLLKLHEWVQAHGGEPIIPFSGKFEAKLLDLPEDEASKYCKEVSHESTFLNMLVCLKLPGMHLLCTAAGLSL